MHASVRLSNGQSWQCRSALESEKCGSGKLVIGRAWFSLRLPFFFQQQQSTLEKVEFVVETSVFNSVSPTKHGLRNVWWHGKSACHSKATQFHKQMFAAELDQQNKPAELVLWNWTGRTGPAGTSGARPADQTHPDNHIWTRAAAKFGFILKKLPKFSKRLV